MDIKQSLIDFMSITGSTWCKYEDLRNAGMSTKGMDEAISTGKIVYSNFSGEDMFTIPEWHMKENRIAINVARIRNADKTPLPQSKIDKMIDAVEKEYGYPYCDEQRAAISKIIGSQLCIVTGGPGTGKTTTLTGALRGLEFANCKNIVFAAPTGKAARRMTESTGKLAKTLHSVLKINADHMDPKELVCDAIVVDEISMLDLDIADALFRAVPTGTRVIMLGDTDQLPSVGVGAILRDMIDSGVVPVARLAKTFRQGNESYIFKNMKKIRDGDDAIEPADDFVIVHPNEKYTAVQELLAIYKKEYDRLGGPEKVCLLTPFRNEAFQSSSECLNRQIQHIVNPQGKAVVTTNNGVFRIGDPVMQLENREEVANGDVGKVIYAKNDSVTVKYIDCSVTYNIEALDRKEVVLAYAMSIHKSQGSEYESVITCLLKEHGPMLQRNLLYTAVTRAKKKLWLVGEDEAVKAAIAEEASCKRVTLLAEKLKYYSLRSNLLAA